MNICMVLANVDFPPDIRVEKEARSLISAGHRVFLLCLRREGRPSASVWNGIAIRRIAPLPFFIRKLNSLFFLLLTRDLQWKRAIRKVVDAHGIDAIHVHDLSMVGTALVVAGKAGLPVIADLHENYPGLVRLAFVRRKPTFAQRTLSPSRWERVEKRWAKRCTHILVVVDEAKERLVNKGIPPEKVTVIENTVDVDHFLSLPVDERLVEEFRNDFVICYTGSFSPHRGLDAAVKAMPQILGEIPNAKLLLVGDGEIMPKLRAFAKGLGLEEKVVFTGWQDFRRFPSYMAAADVCIVPHVSTEHTEATAPHKLYQYMAMGKPVIVSSCRPLRRVVEAARCGLVFEAGDAGAFADCVLKLKNPATRRKMGDAGREAVGETYNWLATSKGLLAIYAGLAGARLERDGCHRRDRKPCHNRAF